MRTVAITDLKPTQKFQDSPDGDVFTLVDIRPARADEETHSQVTYRLGNGPALVMLVPHSLGVIPVGGATEIRIDADALFAKVVAEFVAARDVSPRSGDGPKRSVANGRAQALMDLYAELTGQDVEEVWVAVSEAVQEEYADRG